MHILNLIGFRNRLVVLVQWAWAYFSYQRAIRLITGPANRAARARVTSRASRDAQSSLSSRSSAAAAAVVPLPERWSRRGIHADCYPRMQARLTPASNPSRSRCWTWRRCLLIASRIGCW